MATYHGLIKVSCLVCSWETTDDHTMTTLNDLDGSCPRCEEQFFRWENFNGSIVVSLTQNLDGLHTYENLVYQAPTVAEPDYFSCGSCGGSFLEEEGTRTQDSEHHFTFTCNDCKGE